ncbi:MAG: polyprenyl synthetase family protein [Chromatiales bacterium]|nr:polyprenyl synthetase family protein [Chromatiales bacterium]
MGFSGRAQEYIRRVEATLDRYLPAADEPPQRLHEAMRYSTLGGGKRIRPLLVYATGEALGVPCERLDAPSAAIELMHAFSLVHDDLPAMDDDDLRRGRPTTHRAFDEATAILAADAMQPLAFGILASDPELLPFPDAQVRLVATLAEACGSNGMTGGQEMDLAAEGRRLDAAEIEHIYRLKTGRLLRASVLSGAHCAPGTTVDMYHRLERYIDALGLAFQIQDDILDVEGVTEQTGKRGGSDEANCKATYPAVLGMDTARRRAAELLETALDTVSDLGPEFESLRWTADYIVRRSG